VAEGAAAAGDERTSKRARERAAELLQWSNPKEEPAWIYWLNQAQLEGCAGESALSLRNYAEAEQHLRAAVSLFGATFGRDRALYQCGLAKARLGAGSVEHACATASEAATATRRLNSPRDERRLGEFRQALSPYATSAAVREFDDKQGDLCTIRT
jgi:hypothetical protein